MLTALLALSCQIPLPPLSPAESLDGLQDWLVGRWRTSASEQRGWQGLGFDDSKWIQPKQIPMVDNGVVFDHNGGRWPEPPGIQFAFQHFWHPFATQEGKRTFYRRTFAIPADFTACSTYLSVDDTYELYVNGRLLGKGQDLVATIREFPIGPLLRQGNNVLALSATNTGASKGVRSWTDLHLSFPSRPGQPLAWRCSRDPGPRWSEPDAPDARPGKPLSWKVPVILRADEAVRTGIGSAPMWIDRNFGPQEAVYFRLPLYLDGIPSQGNLRISADNGYEVWVNGKLMGQYRGEKPDVVSDVDIQAALHRGANTIGVKATNFGGPASLTVLPSVKLSL
ncbi:MAG TPA: hypothetical protein VGE01_14470 [Fimbriimonas sp.]